MEAAEEMMQRMKPYIEKHPWTFDGTAIARVFFNSNDITKAYDKDPDDVEFMRSMDRYVRGFNNSHPLWEMIDMKDDIEMTVRKVIGKHHVATDHPIQNND